MAVGHPDFSAAHPFSNLLRKVFGPTQISNKDDNPKFKTCRIRSRAELEFLFRVGKFFPN